MPNHDLERCLCVLPCLDMNLYPYWQALYHYANQPPITLLVYALWYIVFFNNPLFPSSVYIHGLRMGLCEGLMDKIREKAHTEPGK